MDLFVMHSILVCLLSPSFTEHHLVSCFVASTPNCLSDPNYDLGSLLAAKG